MTATYQTRDESMVDPIPSTSSSLGPQWLHTIILNAATLQPEFTFKPTPIHNPFSSSSFAPLQHATSLSSTKLLTQIDFVYNMMFLVPLMKFYWVWQWFLEGLQHFDNGTLEGPACRIHDEADLDHALEKESAGPSEPSPGLDQPLPPTSAALPTEEPTMPQSEPQPQSQPSSSSSSSASASTSRSSSSVSSPTSASSSSHSLATSDADSSNGSLLISPTLPVSVIFVQAEHVDIDFKKLTSTGLPARLVTEKAYVKWHRIVFDDAHPSVSDARYFKQLHTPEELRVIQHIAHMVPDRYVNVVESAPRDISSKVQQSMARGRQAWNAWCRYKLDVASDKTRN